MFGSTYDGGYHLIGVRGTHHGVLEANFDVDEEVEQGYLRAVAEERNNLPTRPSRLSA